ncbi:MAG: hypothetical protein EAZ85_16130 [Bacteroidetes bacterium]|nr:MAG: hypothetical protein EAZ85_16130 [Bacteroidota bacterium]TAG91531.1 MAG: hypothetical protein EAZ20_03240 [Bacteroidota bacterium]
MKIQYSFLLSVLFIYSLCIQNILQAQTDTSKINPLLKFELDDLYAQTKEDLLNIQVSLASKKLESLFDAPLSVSVATHEDIKKAGCTSIMEALRLVPGVIVLEQSNGNFDIHIRGGNNVQKNSLFSVSANTTTLVMIDNRPIYNYYLGGTFWESIPIDLNDVDRIELVRGTAASLYGPNAVSGVINIITKKVTELGLHTFINAQQGSNNTFINNASIGYRFNRKLSFVASANHQSRDRTILEYYNYPKNQYVPLAQTTQPILLGNAYPNPERAMLKQGANLFLQYQPNEKTSFQLSTGWQDSQVQKAYSENFTTPLTTANSNTRYADVKINASGFLGQVSLQNGIQEEGLGSLGQQWIFQSIDAVAEYELNFKNLSIKPGINYRTVYYDDSPFVNVALKTGQFNGRRDINTFAGYTRADYMLLDDKLRLGAALRVDMFNYPNQPYLSYQATANYKLNTQNQFRLVYGRAYRSANIIFTYADRYLNNFNGAGADLELFGNRNLQLLRTDMLELGWRGKINDNWLLDTEFFYTDTRNYADFIYGNVYVRNGTQIQPFSTMNIPLTTQQLGATISVNYVENDFQIKPFLTYQQTTLKNSSPYNNTENALINPNAQQNNINSNLGKKENHQGVPAFFGGIFINYKYKQFNFNLNPYFFSEYTFFSFQNPNYADGRGISTIPTKLMLNAKISYSPIRSFSLYLNVRNGLDSNTKEFYNTDLIGRRVFGGLHFEF